jgi:hypothetical protein
MNRRTTRALAVSSGIVLTISALACGSRLSAQDVEEVVKILDDARGVEPDGASKSEDAAASGDESEEEDARPLFYFHDDSKVAGQPEVEFIEVQTAYGLLKVPTSELVRVRFARRVSPELEESIDRLIEQMGDEDFEARQKASDALADIGAAALPALRRATKSPSEEVKRKAEELLGEIYAQEEEEEEQAGGEGDDLPGLQGTDDELISTRMTIRGRVTQDRFSISSRYGKLTVDTAMLAGIVFRVVGPSSRRVSVAASFQPPGNWFDSRLDVENGQQIRIAASGVVSVSNYGVSCGPDGTTQYATSRSFEGLPVLSLVGKVGKRGKPFLIGSSHKGKAGDSGRLYLSITPFYYNPGGAIGNYQVKIDIGGE